MRRVALLIAIALVAAPSATSAAANQRGERSANACLREHGWDYGLRALLHQELRVRHPNGLVAMCTREK